MNKVSLNKLINFLLYILLLLILLTSSSYSFNKAWAEWKLSEKLRKEGIPTQAVVQSCTRRRGNCSTTYQYEVQSSNQQTKTVTVHENGCNCRKGQEITVLYLPDNPSQARRYIKQYIFSLFLGTVFAMWLIGMTISLFFSNFLIKKMIKKNDKNSFSECALNFLQRINFDLLLFILIFSMPGFLFGYFLDSYIFFDIKNQDEFINLSEDVVKIGIYSFYFGSLSNVIDSKKIKYLISFPFLLFLFLNMIIGEQLWFIIQPLITLVARLTWILHNLIRYVWSLFWGLITIWTVKSWIK